MRIALVCLLATMIGCSSASVPVKTHWVSAEDVAEEYDRCVRDLDGRVIAESMHAKATPSGTWDIFENGAGYGEYATREQAKAAINRRNPDCAEVGQ
jgi:hypothetical protein